MSDFRGWARILLIAVFLGTGLARLYGTEQQVMEFAAYGVPQWLRFAVGLVQSAAVVLLWFKPTRMASAVVLAAIAFGTLFAYQQASDDKLTMWYPLLWLVLIAVAVWPEQNRSRQ